MKKTFISTACVMAAIMTFNAPVSSAYGHDASEPTASVSMVCPGGCPDESPASVPYDDMNSKADNIIGDYLVDHKGEKSKVKIFKNADGSYTAQVFWVQNRTEKDGSVRKDAKNPDKALRNVDCDKIVIVKGLKYDASSRSWTGTTIYDPVRGINASLKASFNDSKTLSLKGTKMGFSETVFWTRL